jgi:hypothetical protein
MSNFITLTEKYGTTERKIVLNTNSIISFTTSKNYTKVKLNILDKKSNNEDNTEYSYKELYVLEDLQFIINHCIN